MVHLPNLRLRILIVDDDPNIRFVYSDHFESKGHEVYSAENAEEAEAIVNDKKTKFDVMITDFQMPNINGMQLIERFEALQVGFKLFILNSGMSEQEIFTTVGDMRQKLTTPLRFFQKPFNSEEMDMVLMGVGYGKTKF